MKDIKALPAMQTFTFGNIPVPVINSTDALVPKSSIEPILSDEDQRALAVALLHNMSALLIGETGTGKTSAVKYLAYKRKQPYVRVNMTGYTTPDELIGSKSVKAGETYYEHGIITDAMNRGAILVIDEINATTPDCLFILHGLLDDDRRITLPNGEVITPHENFRVFATCNPDYEGTKSMNRAFLDRFPIILTVNQLDPVNEKNLIVERTHIPDAVANMLVVTATLARKEYADGKINTFISTRALLAVGKLMASGLDHTHAYRTVIVEKSQNKDERQVLLDFFLSVTKQSQGTDPLTRPVIISERQLQEFKKSKEIADRMEQDIKTERDQMNQMMRLKDKTIRNLQQDVEAQKDESKKKEEEISLFQKKQALYKSIEEYIQSHPSLSSENGSSNEKVEDTNLTQECST